MANEITQTYAVNMIPDSIPAVIHVSQYDAGKRILRFVLYAGSQRYVLPTNAVVTFSGGKSDGTIYEYQMTKVDDSTVQIPVQAQMTAVAGWHSAEIVVYDSETVTGSCNVRLKVERSPSDSSYVPSATELPLIKQAANSYANIQNSERQAKIYQDNAKSSADAAAQSQHTSEGNAQASATNANNASKSASDAAKSATAAATSEKNAMSATPDGYASLANTFNALGLYVDSDGYTCQAINDEAQD